MKRALLFVVLGVIFTSVKLYALEDKIFTSSGQILPGEEWNFVYIYNDDTIVDMLGGSADWIATYDASTLNVTGGHAQFSAYSYSIVDISDGTHSGAEALNYGTVNFSGSASSSFLAASDFGTASMTGGMVEWVGAGNSGIVNIHAGVISDSLSASNSAIVNIYAYDFNYDPTGGDLDGGQITGYWFNDSPFAIDLYGAETYSHINVIPEPSTILLLALGASFITRRRWLVQSP